MDATTWEGLRLRDDDDGFEDIEDTVIRRPRAALSSDRVAAALDDTVIRGRTDDGAAVDDTVVRPGPSVPAMPGASAGVDDDVLGDTVLRPALGLRPVSGSSDGVDGDALGDTVLRPVSHVRPAPGPSDDVDGDPLGDTVLRPASALPPLPPLPPQPGASDGVDDPHGDTVVRRLPPVPGASPDAHDDPFGDTVIRPLPPVPGLGVGGAPARGAPDAADSDATGTNATDTDATDTDATDTDATDTDAADTDAEATVVRAPGRPPTRPGAAGGAAPGLPSAPTERTAKVPSIRIGDQLFRLDHPVVIGRRPSLPRITRGPEPELVTVRSVHGQVSSSHVRLHAEGEAVVVQDLRSTNGTVVRPAGAPAYRMPSGASIVALTGTVVEIGDGNAIEVLSPYLRVAPTADGSAPVPPWPSDQQAHGTPRPTRERS
ncbi:FHA domain-containing protein [Curtobacterium sp. MCLR17_036]|uniref:FHA domain-containing protein n=1 Tax=Curtobacterium sp. MCLR17_036 TaxID=2175620 RepID=UPI0011B42049|nr:FHA domain-containing protein [Curtobacterium sp. MCLR17_036]WIE63568.1 FHA domain-containing protein [Curtobacterium sp. MCLR17_036]